MKRDAKGDGMEWDEMGWDGMGWERKREKGRQVQRKREREAYYDQVKDDVMTKMQDQKSYFLN